MPRFSLLHHSWYNQDIVQEMEHSYSNFFQSTPGSCCRWKWESPLGRCDNCTNTIPVIGTYQMVTWGYGKVDFNLHRSEASPYTFLLPRLMHNSSYNTCCYCNANLPKYLQHTLSKGIQTILLCFRTNRIWKADVDSRNCRCLTRNNLRLGCSTQTVRSDAQIVRLSESSNAAIIR